MNRPLDGAIAGIFPAVATPVHVDGRVDFSTFDRLVDVLVEAGATGICVGGATGEYPHFETADRKELIRRAAARLPPECALLVGIGAPSMRRTIDLGEAALEAGSRAVLLPMPMFFRYEQEDLAAYCAHVSGALRAPCLLYNLPDFTNGLAPETVVRLLSREEFIVGIKDSSGQVENLAAFANARNDRLWTLLVGDDRAIHAGLEAGWNGSISGVAGFCPELLVALYRSHVEGRRDEAARLQGLLDELISQLAPFPAPWGIRIGLAARGIETGPLPLPVTTRRWKQIAAFSEWLPAWLSRTGLAQPRIDDTRRTGPPRAALDAAARATRG
jgi:4-hydroxy-tetrahydrodipicolinate synthase